MKGVLVKGQQNYVKKNPAGRQTECVAKSGLFTKMVR